MSLRAIELTWSRVISPIQVSHQLVAEVFFSVWGINDQGETMVRPGPGGLQVMRFKKPVVVPSVSPTSLLDISSLTCSAH
jgi:hypothetical protein